MTEKGVDFESINYLEHRLSAEKLKKLLKAAGLKPEDALRRGEDAYQQHVAGKNLSDTELIQVMANHPELIQRPIVARGQKAVLARQVEQLSAIDIR